MLEVPKECRRGLTTCKPLSEIASDCGVSFFCCGENDGTMTPIKQDVFTCCFKGPHRDDMSFHDKRDLAHNASVLVRALAIIACDEAAEKEG